MSDRSLDGHVSDERLSAYLDGDANDVSSHVVSCRECAERVTLMNRARTLAASAVEELDESSESRLIASALRSGRIGAARRSRTGYGTGRGVRVAAAALIVGLAGAGITLAVHHGQANSATASAAAAVNGQKAAAAAAAAQAHDAEVAAKAKKHARAIEMQASATGPFASAVVELRRLRAVENGGCAHLGSRIHRGYVAVSAPNSATHEPRAACLLLGPVIVAAWRPTHVTVEPPVAGDGAVSLPLTPGAARALERAGVCLLPSEQSRMTVPPATDWYVVAVQGRSFVGIASLVLEPETAVTARSVLIVAVNPRTVQSLVGELKA